MKNKNVKYDFSLTKDEIKKIFNTPEYSEYKEKKKKTQARREKIYKFTSIGNSTNTVRNLIIANFIFFIISLIIPSILNIFAIYNITDENFKMYQILTSMFLHGGFIHLGFNMFMLWSFGNQIEQTIGINKFLKLYFISGITSGILWMLLGTGPAVGASGALCGLLAAYIFIAPEAKVMMFFIIPMKIKSAAYGFGAFSLIFGLLSLINPTYGFGIGHFAHLGGLIGGYLLTRYWKEKSLIPTF
jgi:membrane associated rhomboid family serine protease